MKSDSALQNKVDSLAETFALIHAHCFQPFYDWDGKAEPDEFSFCWDRLPEKSEASENVDKDFFRKIARFALERLSANLAEDLQLNELARIASAVHGNCLEPFYSHASDFPDYAASYDFNNLPEQGQDSNQLDKQFFLRIARHILTQCPVSRQKV